MTRAGEPDPRAPGGHGWVYRMAEGQQAFSGRHPIQSGICVDATDIRPMTPVERLIFSVLEGFMEVHPRMQAQIEEGATALAASESRADAAEARAETAERRAVPLVQALLAAAPHHQGAHGIIGEAIANALGIPHPIRVPDLIALVETLGIEPPDVWPWEPKHALDRALRREPQP